MSAVVAPTPIPAAQTFFGLDPDMTHLNHGSVGAVPFEVRQIRRALNDEMEKDPRGFFKSRVERTTAAREVCASFVGAPSQRTALVTNVTAGVAQALRAMELSTGDEVITTNHGYGAVDFNIAQYVKSVGVIHRVARLELNPSDDEVIETIMDSVTSRTKLVVCDHVSSMTARLFPIIELSRALRNVGVALLVDAAHVPGHIETDVAAINADFWVGNLHKWAFAPRGSALLAVSPQWVSRIRPFVESWAFDQGFPVSLEFNGTDDFTGWLASPAGISFLNGLGLTKVREHNSALAQYGQHVLADALEMTIDDPQPSPLAMRIIRLPKGIADTPQTAAHAEDEIRRRLRTELAVSCFDGTGVMRIAAQIYNSAADYESLARQLPKMLASL